jgi:hypothetical protein
VIGEHLNGRHGWLMTDDGLEPVMIYVAPEPIDPCPECGSKMELCGYYDFGTEIERACHCPNCGLGTLEDIPTA